MTTPKYDDRLRAFVVRISKTVVRIRTTVKRICTAAVRRSLDTRNIRLTCGQARRLYKYSYVISTAVVRSHKSQADRKKN